jgi:hypothetical protein
MSITRNIYVCAQQLIFFFFEIIDLISFIKPIEQTRSTKNRVLDFEDTISRKHAGKQINHTPKISL